MKKIEKHKLETSIGGVNCFAIGLLGVIGGSFLGGPTGGYVGGALAFAACYAA